MQRDSWEHLNLGLWIVSNGGGGARVASGSIWNPGLKGTKCTGGIALRGTNESSWILRLGAGCTADIGD